jgi:hypothetical protein
MLGYHTGASLVDQYPIMFIHKGDFKIMKKEFNILFHIGGGGGGLRVLFN